MVKEKKNIIRNVRLTEKLDDCIRAIAYYEDRTISAVIQRFLNVAVLDYIRNDSNFVEFLSDFENLEKDLNKDSSLHPYLELEKQFSNIKNKRKENHNLNSENEDFTDLPSFKIKLNL